MRDSRLNATAAAVSLALLTTGEYAIAQGGSATSSGSEMESRIEAGALTSTRPGVLPSNALAITPGIRFANPQFTFSARGSAWIGGDRWQLGDAAATFGAYRPLLYGVRAEVIANASRLFFDPTVQNDQLDAEGRLHFMRQRAGLWLGSGFARPLRVAAVSSVNVSSGGVWTKLGATTLRGSVTSFLFTKVTARDDSVDNAAPCTRSTTTGAGALTDAVPSTNSFSSSPGCRHQSRLTDLEASVHWEHSLLELTVRGGQRFGDSFDVTPDSKQWASMQAAWWITSQMAAVAGGGREPAQPTRGLPARSFGSLGIMLAYWPIPRGIVPIETPASLVQAFEVRPAGELRQRITARIGGVESVEVMGDFSDWSAVPLIRRGRDMWELVVDMMPGMHQINIRIDGGAWIAPPGVPALKDGFNGEVGVLVVRQ